MGGRLNSYYRRRSPWIIQRAHHHVLHAFRSRSCEVSRLGLRNSDPTKEYETIEVHQMILEAMSAALRGEGSIPPRGRVDEGLMDIVRKEFPGEDQELLIDRSIGDAWKGFSNIAEGAKWTKIPRHWRRERAGYAVLTQNIRDEREDKERKERRCKRKGGEENSMGSDVLDEIGKEVGDA